MIYIITLLIWVFIALLTSDILVRLHIALFTIYFLLGGLNVFMNSAAVSVGFEQLVSSENINHLVYCFYLSLYLLVLFAASKTRYKIDFKRIDSRMPQLKGFHIFTMLIALLVFRTQISFINAIINEGYFAYHSGDISFQKSPLDVVLEWMLIVLVLGREKRSSYLRIYSVLFIVFQLLSIMSGLRLPGLINIIVYLIAIRQGKIVKLNFSYSVLLGITLLVLPTILMAVQRIRMGYTLNGDMLVALASSAFNEIATQTDLTAETFRAVLFDPKHVGVSWFFNFKYFFVRVYEKVLGIAPSINAKADLGAFSFAFVRAYAPSLYSKGLSFGGAAVSESFAILGPLGLILAGLLHGTFYRILFQIRKGSKNRAIILYSHILLGTQLIRSVRGSTIDWLMQCIIMFFFSLVLVVILKHRWFVKS